MSKKSENRVRKQVSSRVEGATAATSSDVVADDRWDRDERSNELGVREGGWRHSTSFFEETRRSWQARRASTEGAERTTTGAGRWES